MAESISIVMKMTEDITGVSKSISSATKGCSKEFELLQRQTQQLGQRYSELNKQAAQVTSKALSVKRQMEEAKKEFRKTGDEAARLRFASLKEEYDNLTNAAKGYSTAAKETVKDMNSVMQTARKIGAGNSSVSSGIQPVSTNGNLGTRLASSGIINALGASISGGLSALVESTVGQPVATAIGTTLSGTISGAAAGAVAGPIGALIGAGVGTLSGGINAATDIYEKKDDAFKDYYKGLHETVTQATDEGLTSGKVLAASRETDKLAFSSLLGGSAQANQFLDKLIKTADTTPFQYDDLTGLSKTLLTFGYAAEDIIPTLTKVGDAGATMGLSTSDIGTVATYIGRMKSSDKASLEYLRAWLPQKG